MFNITYRFLSKQSNNIKNINKTLEFHKKQSELITKLINKHNNSKTIKYSLSESHSNKPFVVYKPKN